MNTESISLGANNNNIVISLTFNNVNGPKNLILGWSTSTDASKLNTIQ